MGNPFIQGTPSLRRDALFWGGYLVFLFGSLPFMPGFWFGMAKLGKWYRSLPEGIGCFLVLLSLKQLFHRRSRHLLLKGVLFTFLAVFFFFLMSRQTLLPERIHFSEYGLLAFLTFRLLRHWKRSRWVYGWTLVGACLIGFLDELVQGLLPNRVYDLRDIWMNGLASSIGLIVVVLLFDPFFVQ